MSISKYLKCGGGGGQFKTNRLLHHDENTPLINLFILMCHMASANVESLGDSARALKL